MKISEALTRIKELKADAHSHIENSSSNITKAIYLEIKDKYKIKDTSIQPEIESAIQCLTEAHILKLAVQKANVTHGLADLIQEADLLKSLCTAFKSFVGIEEETDPSPCVSYNRQTMNTTFQIRKANFDTNKMDNDYAKWQERIREINFILQTKNWEEHIDDNDLNNEDIKDYL